MPARTVNREHARARKGRGAGINPEGRFEGFAREAFDDGWAQAPAVQEARGEPAGAPALETHVTIERAKSIISRNDSPDIPFSRSINPYRGCEHGCIYCYARPSHAYLNLSPGVDFETRLFAKANAAELLRAELSRPGYECDMIALGANTDPYQPIERKYRITRGILEVLAECKHPVAIVTKNALIERDTDILSEMARKNLARVFISLCNLDPDLARRLEPRCSAPARRLEAIRRLSARGIPVGVIVAPVIPFLTDDQVESVLEAAFKAGAREADYTLLRLPYEVKDLFRDWLETHYPLKARHVMSRVNAMRGGRDNDAQFGSRMCGSGEFAALLRMRFEIACERLGFNARGDRRALDTTRFRPPHRDGQLELF
ncbi:MAG: PA0069 family radical SAM protein [Betaproteobacteria bacterium]|nr:PA0069 family radical SAM protein [Betaproteobacteria bacterium]